MFLDHLPSGNHTNRNEQLPCLMLIIGKLTISMAIVNSYIDLPEGTTQVAIFRASHLFKA